MERRAVIRSCVIWTCIGSVLGMCLSAALRVGVPYFITHFRATHWAAITIFRLSSMPAGITLGALTASVLFGRKYQLSRGFYIRSVGVSVLGFAIGYGLQSLIPVIMLPLVLAMQFALFPGERDSNNLTLTPRDDTLSPKVAPVLATISAIFGLLNPRLVEFVLWYTGNPLPYGAHTIVPSVFCAVISALTGTVAFVMIEKFKHESRFKYAALVGAGISYPFILYYLISAIAIFSKLSRIH